MEDRKYRPLKILDVSGVVAPALQSIALCLLFLGLVYGLMWVTELGLVFVVLGLVFSKRTQGILSKRKDIKNAS